MALNRQISYIGKDFSSLRQNLIDYSKTYFPTTYTDFSPSSPGMMFIEMAAYVGDVMSFYLDKQINETFIQYASQQKNLFNLAYSLGYRPKVTSASTVEVDFYQLVPSKLSGSTYIPDFDYALLVSENTILNSSNFNNSNFLLTEKVDFKFSSSYDPTEVSVYQLISNEPSLYLLKKTKKAISANITTTSFNFTNPTPFQTVTIEDSNIIGILDAVDSDGNEWYEVPYLAQETIYDSIKNTNTNDPNFSIYNDTPYLLKLKKIQRRFVTRFLDNTTLQLEFGSGQAGNNDEEIIPNPTNVGIDLPYGVSKLTTAYSPTNFLYTNTYGIAPSKTTITVRYLTGGGVSSNIPANSLTIINKSNTKFQNSNLNPTTAQTIFDSLQIINPSAASGGGNGDTNDDLRLNSLNSFQTQLRTISKDDYTIRALSMPSQYGAIAKIYTEAQKVTNLNFGELPSVLEMYVLSFNNNKNLAIASKALKQNLSTYLSQGKAPNDTIKIKDAFIINIGVQFEIIVLPDYNSSEVLLLCINALKDYFNIDKWQINQPIQLKDIYILLDKINGVQTVKSVNIYNISGENLGYSKYSYDVDGATKNNVIYPSLDASIFEVKYPDNDISGRISTF
jgi:hypothetical protein